MVFALRKLSTDEIFIILKKALAQVIPAQKIVNVDDVDSPMDGDIEQSENIIDDESLRFLAVMSGGDGNN